MSGRRNKKLREQFYKAHPNYGRKPKDSLVQGILDGARFFDPLYKSIDQTLQGAPPPDWLIEDGPTVKEAPLTSLCKDGPKMFETISRGHLK